MRHFSGELEGLRLLMADELDLIAGGDGEDTDDQPQPPPTELEQIVVTANVTTQSFIVGQLFHFYGTGGTPTGGGVGGVGGGPPTPDCKETQVEFDASATADPDAPAIVAQLSNAIEQQSDRVRAIPNSLVVDYPTADYPFTTGAELKSLWSKTDFIVTGIADQPGYGGRVEVVGGSPTNTVMLDYLPSYLANDAREAWYFFHELAHATARGQELNAVAYSNWQSNSGGVAFANSWQFQGNETIMNTVAANLASLFGIDLRSSYANVPHGYLGAGEYGVSGTPATLTPDTANAGPGGTCS
jgi:hypothetical protein